MSTTTKSATPKVQTSAKATPSNCGCGCGKPAITSKARFLPGHDARHAGVLGRALAASPKDKALLANYASLTDGMRSKVDKIRTSAESKGAEKAAREVAKVAAAKAYAAAMAKAGFPVA